MRTLSLLSCLFGIVLFALTSSVESAGKPDPNDCEVCISALTNIQNKVKEANQKDLINIEETIGNYCAKPGNEKENKLVSIELA